MDKRVLDVAIRRAALQSLNEMGAEFLVVGDVAAFVNKAKVSPQRLEIWLKPDAAPTEISPVQMKVWGRIYDKLDLPEGEVGRIGNQVKIRQEMPNNKLSFEAASAQAVSDNYCDQPIRAVSPDHLTALKLAAAKTPEEVNAAGQLLAEMRKGQSRGNDPDQGPSDGQKPELRLVPKPKL